MTAPSRRLTIIWAGLVLATVASWLLGVEHAADDVFSSDVVAGLLIAITAVKVWYVGLDFMELREAAPWLSRLFTGWLAATSISLGLLLIV